MLSRTTAYEPPVPTTSTAAPKFEDEHPLVAAFNMLENPPYRHRSPFDEKHVLTNFL